MTTLYALALGLVALALLAANVYLWAWAWGVVAEARRERRDAALVDRLADQRAVIARLEATLAAQCAELAALHAAAGGAPEPDWRDEERADLDL